jgi:DNA ligase (NAD+)
MRLATFVGAFDIEGVGETSAEKLIGSGFDSLEKLLNATEDQIAAVYGFAEIMAHIIVEGLAENAAEMRSLVSSGIIELEEAGVGLLAGKSFCFTGELVTMKRADAEQLVKKNGGSIKSSVTKDLSYLVTNDTSSGSSKNVKAAKLGIPVIDEKQFIELLG